MEQWRNKNPEWEYKAFTSPPTELFMYFTGIPELAAVYNDIEEVRPDLMRWLLLWYHGGVFADVDTWDRIGMRGCKPTKDVVQERRDVSLVIGIETDEPFLSQEGLRKFGLTRGFGFGNVVVWAPKRFDPVVRRAIVYTVSHARAHLNKSITALNEMSKRKEEYLDELSGKHMFTDALLEVLSDSLEKGHALRDGDAGLERRVTWKWFKGLKNPLWIMSDEATKEKREAQMRGLAILPIKTWSSGQNHSDSGSMEDVAACVNHAPGRRPGKRGSV
jgi:alpha 1,6-mannosyltransferase